MAWLLGLTAIGWSSACARFFMVGSEPVSGLPQQQAIATYRIPKCALASSRLEVEGPSDQTYRLTMEPGGQLMLYELDQAGAGAMITSHWVDKGNDHFFTYIPNRNGWEYVIPQDRAQPGERLVYKAGTYTVAARQNHYRVASGTPMLYCPMIRTDMRQTWGLPATAVGAGPQPQWAPPPPPAAYPPPVAYPPPAGYPPPAPTVVAAQCDTDADCKGNRTCVDHHCAWRAASQRCEKDVDCPGDAVCKGSTCVDPGAGSGSTSDPSQNPASRTPGSDRRRRR